MKTKDKPARRMPGDEAIISALACGHPYSEAARVAGVSDRTVRRRMQDPLFRAEVEEMRRTVMEQTSASLAQLAGKAVPVLEECMNNGEPWLRQKTALAVVELSIRDRETREMEERLIMLEEEARVLVHRREPVA